MGTNRFSMTPCIACGQPFDNEQWFLATTPDGEPRLRMVRNARCPACWKQIADAAKRNPSGCHLFFGNDPPLKSLPGVYWVT